MPLSVVGVRIASLLREYASTITWELPSACARGETLLSPPLSPTSTLSLYLPPTPSCPKLLCANSNPTKRPPSLSNLYSNLRTAIGPEEKAIFADIVRVLKPGGLFVWGNALPTSVWNTAADYLPQIGFEPCGSLNHTAGAIVARDEDKERVDMYVVGRSVRVRVRVGLNVGTMTSS